MPHRGRVAARWVARTLGLMLALLATLFVLYFFLTNSVSRPLFSEPASSVSNAPGP